MIPDELLKHPTIRLHGKVDDAMLDRFMEQMAAAIDRPELLQNKAGVIRIRLLRGVTIIDPPYIYIYR